MERAVFGTILELREEKHEAGRNEWRQHEEEVNKWPTSRRAISPSQSKRAKRDQNSGGIEIRTD